jgi:superfamily II RNA helicase
VEEEHYLERFKPVLMDVIYHWSLGKTFAEVSKQQHTSAWDNSGRVWHILVHTLAKSSVLP